MKMELNIPMEKRKAGSAHFRFTPLMAIIIVKGDDFLIRHASYDIPSIWGRNTEEILGKPFFNVFPILKNTVVEKLFITGLRSMESQGYKRFKHSQSVSYPPIVKHLDLQVEPLLEDGQVAGLILFALESPPKSRSSKNQMKVRALFNEGADRISFGIGKFGIWNWYVKTGKVYWSKDQENLFGLEEGEFSGTFREFLNFVHPEDLCRIKDRPGFAHNAEPEHQYEYRIRRKDGQVRWIQTRSRTVFSNSELEYVTGINIDVTEQKEYQKRLEESEKEWKGMANAMPQLVWVADASGKVIYYNRRIEEYAGASKLVDGTWHYQALFHADDVDATTAAWLRSFQEGTFFEQEHRLRMKDGSYRWHLNRAVPYRNKEGEIIKWYGTATDIHDLKATQEKLKENEERFRSLAENSPDIITRHARDHTYLYASPPIEKYLKISPEAFIGQSYWDLGFPKPLCEFFDRHLTIAFETEQLQTVEFEMPGEIFVLSRMVPEYNDKGEMVSVLILSTDISERKKAEKKLQYLATLTRSIPDAVVGTDLDYRITCWNNGAEKIYGWKEEEVLGKSGKEVLHTQFPNGDADLWKQALDTTGFWHGEVVQKRKDGSAVPILVSISHVRDVAGRLIGSVGVNRDISGQKCADEPV
jgi:PAS domain S-box-containing protein